MSNYKDGRCGTPTYRSYCSMVARCNPNSKHKKYKNYTDRGITVCDRWLEDYRNFLADMGERPDGTTLDRKDNDKGYYPDNCRWATPKEQANNRRMRRDKLPRVNSKTGVIHVSKHTNGGYDVRVGRGFRKFTWSFEEACQIAKEARLKIYGDSV